MDLVSPKWGDHSLFYQLPLPSPLVQQVWRLSRKKWKIWAILNAVRERQNSCHVLELREKRTLKSSIIFFLFQKRGDLEQLNLQITCWNDRNVKDLWLQFNISYMLCTWTVHKGLELYTSLAEQCWKTSGWHLSSCFLGYGNIQKAFLLTGPLNIRVICVICLWIKG